jgi:hypothetical protein
MPWCIGGDFNVTLFMDERLRGAAVAEQGLMDLPMDGGDATWSNSVSWSRLDRFLVSPGVGVQLSRSYAEETPPGVLGSRANSPC